MQGIDRACRQPACDFVAYLRRGKGQRAQLLDRLRHGPGMALTLIGRAFERRGQIGALALPGVPGKLPPELSDEAAGRLARYELISEVVRGDLAR
ncbi:hypothetical protein D3C81_1802150 [compost metagenome]